MSIESAFLKAINDDVSESETVEKTNILDETLIAEDEELNDGTDLISKTDMVIEDETVRRENKVRITQMLIGMSHNPLILFDKDELKKYYNRISIKVVKKLAQGMSHRLSNAVECMGSYK